MSPLLPSAPFHATTAVNRCIYCNAAPGPSLLSMEHVVPESLGGRIYLRKASCKGCAKLTSGDETTNIAGIFAGVRAHFKMKGSKSRRSRTRIPVTVHHHSGHDTQQSVEASQLKNFSVAIGFLGPTILTGADTPLAVRLDSAYLNPTAPGVGAAVSTTIERIDTPAFARMLAKIGHSYAVKMLGLEGFSPGLQRFIRRLEEPSPNGFIGTEQGQPIETAATYQIGLSVEPSFDGREMIVCSIRFFPSTWLPTYRVVVGLSLPSSLFPPA